MRYYKLFSLTTFVILIVLMTKNAYAQTETAHRKGPDGLEGWNLLAPIEDQGDLPMYLIIARNGKTVTKLSGDPFIWKWIFLQNGKQIAYESGPLHFGLICKLMDISSGNVLDEADCYTTKLAELPAWAKILETDKTKQEWTNP